MSIARSFSWQRPACLSCMLLSNLLLTVVVVRPALPANKHGAAIQVHVDDAVLLYCLSDVRDDLPLLTAVIPRSLM